ncbi:MAG: GAF domain-containing protein, partial [Baekduiaceae bacterium]
MRTEQAVARAVAGAAESADAQHRALQAVCESLGWSLAATWEPGADDVLRCTDVWCAADPTLDAFAEATRTFTFQRGEGLPGHVWATGEPAWITDATTDVRLPRRPLAADAGLHAAIGVPIVSGRGVSGVLECF